MLQRMRIGQKFVLMGAIFFIALLIVTYRMVATMRELGTEFAQKEVYGLAYQDPLVHLLRSLQTHRGLAVGLLEGEAQFEAQLQAASDQIVKDVEAVDAVDVRYGDMLGVSKAWAETKQHTLILTRTWRDAGRESFDKHTEVIARVLSLVARVGDASNLSFDPNPASYYLSDATRIAIPELAEIMGQVRDLALGIATQGGAMREEELKAFSRRYAIVYYYTDRLQADYAKVYAADEQLRSSLEGRRSAVTEAAADFLHALEREFISAEYAKVSPADWWNLSTHALDATYALYQATTPALTQVLEARQASLSRQLMITIALLGLGLAVVTGLAVLIIRDINQPLSDAVQAAEQLARGDLSVSLNVNGRRDEIGVLAGAFGRMVAGMRNMADAADRISRGDLAVDVKPQSEHDVMGTALARMTVNLQGQTRQLLDEIDQLSTANRSISSAMAQVVAGTQRAASSVEQAASTVAEVKDVAQSASEKAAEVATKSGHAVEISEIGEKAVQDAVDGIEKVRDQMKLIAKKVLMLGEQTRAIAQITGTVSDLADQSDLLSVNAGIEAVRAGVHGKGFAVVAQEVKNLSDRSKRATAQISGILGDIQKAANDVILASEQATKAADVGIQQTIDSGEAIRSLAQSLAEATASVASITDTSRRQLVDMDQIAEAMDLIRDASTQNVSSVEQIEHSIGNLAHVSSSLQDLVKRYRLAT